MTMLADRLRGYFHRGEAQGGVLDIVWWWERRRFTYNVIVGCVGIVGMALFLLFISAAHGLEPGEDAVEPMALIIAPIAINILYTAGWFCELMLWVFRLRSPRVGPALLKVGTYFSIFVVMLPSVIWGCVWAFRRMTS